MDKSYTILLVPDRDAKVKKLRIEHRTLVQAAAALCVAFVGFVVMVAHYASMVAKNAESQLIRAESLELKNHWTEAEKKFAHLNNELDRVKRLNSNLRHLTQLNQDGERKMATLLPKDSTGPASGAAPAGFTGTDAVGAAPEQTVLSGVGGSRSLAHSDAGTPPATEGDLLRQLDDLSKKVAVQEKEATALKSYFEDQQALLSSAPSIWPVRGWVTSDFMVRLDPYTGERVMHEGLDIAAGIGTAVHAPADGTVVFNGIEGGYGHVLVVDHGYGLKTRYGHLSRVDVKVGEKIRRGQLIAAVGNSGRSTGPHLHYEVRVNGVADNPRKFILEE